jgi:hypothetical protein
VEVLSYGSHHIDTLIWDVDHHVSWCGTFVYGEPRVQDRHIMWELLRKIMPRTQAPWLMIRDFNEALWGFEHFSSRQRPECQMADFRYVLGLCNLHDLGFVGVPWMFNNKQVRDKNVKVCLDRAVASPSWSEWFLDSSLRHMASSRSDHTPILLQLEKDNMQSRVSRIPWYKIMSEREDSLTHEINQA